MRLATFLLIANLASAQDSPATREAQLLRQLDGNSSQARDALIAARRCETPKLVTKITGLARTSTKLSTRWNAIETLGFFANTGGDEVLLAILGDLRAKRADVRLVGATFEALGRRKYAAAFDVLVTGLAEGQIQMRGAGAGLEHLADPRAFDPLMQAFRPFEVSVLNGLPLVKAMFACDRERALRFFAASMSDAKTPDPYRFRFEQILRANPGDDVATAARRMLGSKYDDAVRRGLRIIGACKRTKDVPVLTEMLHSQPQHRRAAAEGLRLMSHDQTVMDLARYLNDTDAKLRAHIAQAIGSIAAKRATPSLVRRLAVEEDLIVRHRIVEALARIRDERAVAGLIPLLEERTFLSDPPFSSMRSRFPYNTETRFVALWALQCIRDGKPRFDLKLKNPNLWEVAAPASEFEAWQTWWQQHSKDPRYRITPR